MEIDKIMKKILFLLFFFSFFLNAQVELKTDTGSNFLSFQKISVTIGGDFFVNGSFPALATERVDDLLTRLYNQAKQTAFVVAKDELTLSKIKKEFDEYALRDIKLKRFDGTERKLDLAKFRLNGDFSNNPYLKNGDVLIIPKLDLERNFVEIDGAINEPKKIQFVEGDQLSDVVFFALGINKAYENVSNAEITRLSYDGNTEEIINTKIDEQFDLQRGDRIKIIADETQRKSFSALVIGEVKKPGYVYITKNNTTLNKVIEKAGGLTEKAWLKSSKIIRGLESYIRNQENLVSEFQIAEIERELKQDIYKMTRLSNLHVEDTAYFAIENELRLYNEFGITDFTEIDDPESEISKTIVKNDDIIIIPEFEKVVYLFGQIPKTGKYGYAEGMDYDYYINKAGGLTDESDNNIMLIKGLTKEWINVLELEEKNIKIEPGDYLWVRKEPLRDFGFYLQRTGAIAGIIGSVATIILLINQFGK